MAVEAGKKLHLGVEVALHILVVVEVLGRQVGEHRAIEMNRGRAPLFEGVRGDLDDGALASAFDHLGKKTMKVEATRRRILGGVGILPNPVLDGAAKAR